jgi:PAS domain S-box-containing protein
MRRRATELEPPQESGERSNFEIILSSIEHAITVQDPNGRLIYANDSAAALTGYSTADELVRAPIAEVMSRFEVFAESGAPFPLSQLPGRRVLKGERPDEIVLKFRVLATGEERWSVVSATPVVDLRGRVKFAVNVFREITESKRESERQRFLDQASTVLASSLDYETTLNSVARLAVPIIADWCAVDTLEEGGSLARLAVAHVDPAKVEFAQELERRYPTRADALTGVPKVIRTGQAELIPQITDAMLVAEAQEEEQLRLFRDLGPRSCILVPMIARGRTLGAITLVSAESRRQFGSADLRLAEDLARRAAVALDNARLYRESERAREQSAASERRFRAVYQNAMDAMLITDDQLRYLDANPAACSLFGVPREQLIGRKIHEFGKAVQFQNVEQAWGQFVQEGEQQGEFLLTRPDGQVRILEYNAVAQFLPGQHLSVLRDVTTRRQVERERARLLAQERAANDQARRETELREELLRIVGHDLRDPLGAISMTGHLLLNSGKLDASEHKKVMRIVASSERMSRLISQLLEFSRVQAGGKLPIKLTETNLKRVCEQMVDELRAANPNRRIEIQTLDVEIVGLWDPDRIAELISNLIGNAIRYGDGASAVTVRLGLEGTEAVIDIHNWGDPIPEDLLPSIFEPFTRGRKDTPASVGLGLYIVQQIVLAHKGRIEVTSSAAKGTRFTTKLPLRLP